MEFTDKNIDRFWSKVDIDLNYNACWEWQAHRDKNGYGTLRIKSKPLRAHRVAYMIERGDIPDGLVICHKCDNPPCVNPNHLFTGTQADNLRDRYQLGERNPNAKLTEQGIPIILSLIHI